MAVNVPASAEPSDAKALRTFQELLELERRIDGEIDSSEQLATFYKSTMNTVIGRYKRVAKDLISRRDGVYILNTGDFRELSEETKKALAEAAPVLEELGGQLRRNLNRVDKFSRERLGEILQDQGQFDPRLALGETGLASGDPLKAISPEVIDQLKGVWPEPQDRSQEFTVGQPGVVGRFYQMSLDHRQMLADTFLQQMAGNASQKALAKALSKRLNTTEWQAKAFLRDSTMQFSRELTRRQGEATGMQYYQYVGPDDAITRPWCDKHLNRIYSIETIDTFDNGQTGLGTAFTAGGGYNCRHRWIPVRPEWYDRERWERLSSDPYPDGPTRPQPEPEPEPPAAPQFPDTVDDVTVVQQLGGSTGAKLVQDSFGQKFVMKTGNSPEHIRAEFMADELYRAAGVRTPPSRLYETDGGPVKLARFIEGGVELGRWMRGANGLEKAQLAKELQEGVRMDVAMANWDVIGQDADNILVDPDGVPWRIDNGGALNFRAMGSAKGRAWNEHPIEFATFTDSGNSAAQYFTDKSFGKVRLLEQTFSKASAKRVRDAVEKVAGSSAADADTIKMLSARVASLEAAGATYERMKLDGYNVEYLSDFLRHHQTHKLAFERGELRDLDLSGNRAGTFDTPGPYDGFDHGRGSTFRNTWSEMTSHRDELSDYFNKTMTMSEQSLLMQYAGQQAGDSWSTAPRAFKQLYITRIRPQSTSDVFLYGEQRTADAFKRTLGTKTLEDAAMSAYAKQHAFTFTYLSRAKFHEAIQHEPGTIRLLRTESSLVVSANGLKRNEWNDYKKGPIESSSIFSPVQVAGSELQVFAKTPIHRIFATYLQHRPGTSSSMFLGDRENEATVDLNGVPSHYGGVISTTEAEAPDVEPSPSVPLERD